MLFVDGLRFDAARRLTARLTKQICDYARQNPAAHLSDIAVHFNVNPGRVSEVLNGKR